MSRDSLQEKIHFKEKWKLPQRVLFSIQLFDLILHIFLISKSSVMWTFAVTIAVCND